MEYPQYVKTILDKLSAAGFEAYIVGGSLRDMLIGRDPSDFDVTTSALPEEILEVFSDMRTIPTGLKHGTVTVLSDGEPIEVTTFRTDGEYLDSRHPESVSFTNDVCDDLSRRDFSVNAIAYNEKRGIVDTTFMLDERICDGYYFATAYKYLKRFFKNPALLELPPETVIEDIK